MHYERIWKKLKRIGGSKRNNATELVILVLPHYINF